MQVTFYFDAVTSPAVVKHTMKIVSQVVQTVNPGQTVIMTGDQPVYAIGKQVQWLYPDIYLYREQKLIMMIGALHIEMSFLSAIGDWLEGSGWVELMIKLVLIPQEEQRAFYKEAK